jgi:hypothetical protein
VAVKRPPKLTRQEFLRKAPINPVAGRTGGQRYQSYLTAYQRQYKPVRTQAPQNALPTIASLLSRVGQFETPAQLEARANRMANAGVTAQQAIIREEAKRLRDEALLRMQSMAAAGRAAAAQNAGLFGMVGGEYNSAASEIRGLGTNLSNQMQQTDAGNQLALNAGLSQVGAPAMPVGGPAGANTLAGPEQAGVESYRGGELPGQAISNAGQAATFGLAGMVSAQNLRATQEAQAAMNESVRTADAARISALKELAAGRPSQAMQFLQQLQEAQRQQVGLASGLIQQRSAMRQAGFGQSMAKKEYGQKVAQQKFQNQVTLQELAMKATGLEIQYGQVDAAKSMALGYVVDAKGRPILKNGKRIPAKRLLQATSSSSKGRSMTPGQQVELFQKAQDTMDALYYGYKVVDGKRVPATQSPDFDPNDISTYGTGQATYTAAITRLTQMGVGKAYAQNMANSLYLRGQGGRPILTAEEKRKLSKKLGSREANQAVAAIQKMIDTGGPGTDAAVTHRVNEILQAIYGG